MSLSLLRESFNNGKGAIAGFLLGVVVTHDLIKQEIKTGVICFGRRVYRVVHSTDIRNVK